MRDIGIVRAVRDVAQFALEEHFGSGGIAGTNLDNFTETSSAAGTNTKQAGGLQHPGVLRLTTGAASTNNKRLHVGSTANDANFSPALFDRYTWIVRLPTITTLTVRLGLMQDISAASGGTAGAFFEFDPAVSANWQFIARQASTSTSANAVAVTANNWYLLEARRLSGGSWEFWVNDTLRATHATNTPTTSCAFGCLVQTGAAAARSLDLDYVACYGGFGQLFT